MAIINSDTPRNLTTWTSYRNAWPNAGPANLGTEFSGRDAPKLKFLFTVEFVVGTALFPGLADGTGAWDGEDQPLVELGSSNMARIKYACKNVTRPNINVNYVPVNSYNRRFQVATKVDYGTVSLTLYDDNKNYAHYLFTEYLNMISPVSNISAENHRLTDNPIQHWASLGPLEVPDRNGLIQKMRVTHHYTDTYSDDGNSHKLIHYDYINPKIQTFALDDLDMSISDASTINLTFVYDAVNIVYATNVDVGDMQWIGGATEPLTTINDGSGNAGNI